MKSDACICRQECPSAIKGTCKAGRSVLPGVIPCLSTGGADILVCHDKIRSLIADANSGNLNPGSPCFTCHFSSEEKWRKRTFGTANPSVVYSRRIVKVLSVRQRSQPAVPNPRRDGSTKTGYRRTRKRFVHAFPLHTSLQVFGSIESQTDGFGNAPTKDERQMVF